MLQSPLALGATCVVYSATKHIDGQGRCLGGVILASEKFITDHIHTFLRQTGPALSPFNAWVMLKGLETLALPGRQAGRQCRASWPMRWPRIRPSSACSTPTATTIRRPSSPAAR